VPANQYPKEKEGNQIKDLIPASSLHSSSHKASSSRSTPTPFHPYFKSQVDFLANYTSNCLPAYVCMHGWTRSISLRHAKKFFAKSSLGSLFKKGI
jgi:hypothetical protein